MTKFAAMALEIISAVLGVLLVWLTLRDVFQTVVVPRAPFVSVRPSSVATKLLWRAWPALTAFARSERRRQDLLGAFAPLDMVLLLILWAALTGLGYGLIFYALRAQLLPQPMDFHTSLYFAYSTMLTIGYGDVLPHSPLTRALAVVTGGSGLGLVAVVTSYLFSIFGSFAARERYVIALAARAGAAPSGSALLETHGYAKLVPELPGVMRDGQTWIAGLVQSQLAYPILGYFRSGDAGQSWVGTLGLLLDAATLIVTTLEDVPKGEAEIAIEIGRRAARDLSRSHAVGTRHEAGCAKEHFERTAARLAAAGYRLRDLDDAWDDYARVRATYAPELNAVANYFRIPSLPWSDASIVSGP